LTRSGSAMFATIDFLEEVGSTNDYLKQFIDEKEPKAAVARSQRAGKGQYGRSWHSPSDQGLYASYLVFPEWETEKAFFLNQITGLAVVSVVRRFSAGRCFPTVKDPNDVLIGRRKVAGALTELGSQENRIQWAVAGVGVNLNHTGFPPDLEPSATSLKLEAGVDVDRLEFFGALTREWTLLWRLLQNGEWAAVDQRYQELKQL
jgi:BirA family transcriptional regulator, biotin operon repressor / biotin---[acetyl-CoA-carboxylase] ligase